MAKDDLYDLLLQVSGKLDKMATDGIKSDNSDVIAALATMQTTLDAIKDAVEVDAPPAP